MLHVFAYICVYKLHLQYIIPRSSVSVVYSRWVSIIRILSIFWVRLLHISPTTYDYIYIGCICMWHISPISRVSSVYFSWVLSGYSVYLGCICSIFHPLPENIPSIIAFTQILEGYQRCVSPRYLGCNFYTVYPQCFIEGYYPGTVLFKYTV